MAFDGTKWTETPLVPIAKPLEELTEADVLHNLRVVLQMMETGIIKDEAFDITIAHNRCGTVHCVGGWLTYLAGHPTASIDHIVHAVPFEKQGELCEMFFRLPYRHDHVTEDIIGPSVAQTIPVIRHFLETGKTDWNLSGFDGDEE